MTNTNTASTIDIRNRRHALDEDGKAVSVCGAFDPVKGNAGAPLPVVTEGAVQHVLMS